MNQPPRLALPEEIANQRQQELAAQAQALQMRAQLGAEIYARAIANPDLVTMNPGMMKTYADYSLEAAMVFFEVAGLVRRVDNP